MLDSALIQVFLSAGVAGVMLLCFMLGWVYPRSVVMDLKEENKELKEALEAERDRANSAIAAATTTRDVLTAIQVGQTIRTSHDP
jgi:flagellar biosynthesis/type III secretory pathway M-ring protein FliF/YscJ